MTPVGTPLVTLRYGEAADLARIIDLHDRCSEGTLSRRFHTPLPRTPVGLALRTLEPDNGWSMVAELDRDLAGIACAGPISTTDLEVGLLVEDAHQGLGIGSALLREVALDAAARGYRSLLVLTQPGNEAVIATVARAGLVSSSTWHDGLMSIVMRLPAGLDLRRPA